MTKKKTKKTAKKTKKDERREHPRHDLETAAEITVEEAEAEEVEEVEEESSADQRAHERVNVSYEINIEAGLKLGGQEVMRLTLVGKTVDVSLGGMRIHVDRDVIPGARCDVHFLDADGMIEPVKTWGRVRRSKPARDGFELAVQFDSPLDVLDN